MAAIRRCIGRRPVRAIGAAVLIAVLAALTVAVPAAVSAQEEPEDETDIEEAAAQPASAVSIVDFAFNPATVTVPVGGRVTWTNTGQRPHTTTSTGGVWNSGQLTSGQSFSFTFNQPGSFAYQCTIHPQMRGTVNVQGAVGGPGPAAQPAAPRPAAQPAAPAAQRPVAVVAQPVAQRPAAAPARPAVAPARPAVAPARPAPARPPARPAAVPRAGTGGALAADNVATLPLLALGAGALLMMTGVAVYRRRRA